jgi:YegS/Rv2252/BmrU family lipid kinase
MRKALFVYNPKSGNRAFPARLDYVVKRFMAEDIILHPFRIGQGEDDRLKSLLSSEGYSFIVASGGDGTISYAVDSMFKCNISIPVGIIPSGTCNDLARNLSISDNLEKAITTVLNGKTVSIDTGLINEKRYFINTCAGGAFVDVSYTTSDELKKNIGPLAYYITGLSSLASIKPFNVRIKTDSDYIEEEIILFIILNGRHVGGFNNVSNEADLTDGLMDIILIKNCPPYELPGLFFRVLNNSLLQDKRVSSFKSNFCRIESDEQTYLSVDGEKAGELPITVRFIKRNLQVFVPESKTKPPA